MSKAIDRGKDLCDKVSELNEAFDNESSSIEKFRAIIPYCKNFLEECGFKVIPPYRYKYDHIDKLSDLVDFFYEKFRYTYPEKLIARNEKLDLKIAKAFVKAIKDKNAVSKKAALTDCAEIIDVVISNANQFEYIFNIGFKVFGQENMSFITERAVRFINIKRDDSISDNMEVLLKEAMSTYDGGDIGILSDMEERNGQEKK